MKTYKEISSKLDDLNNAIYSLVHDLMDKNTNNQPVVTLANEALRNCSFLLDAVCDSLENLED